MFVVCRGEVCGEEEGLEISVVGHMKWSIDSTPSIYIILTCSHLEDDQAPPWVPFEQGIALAKA